MLKTYLAYFAGNYLGNRAPVHIGHHFSKWNGGAYWKAMQEFAQAVCGLPEVRCVTYRELEDYMEALPASAFFAYREGRFEKSEFPAAAAALARAESGLEADLALSASDVSTLVRADVSGPHAGHVAADKGAVAVWSIDGQEVARGPARTLDLKKHAGRIKDSSKLTVSIVHGGREVLRATHGIQRTRKGFKLTATPDEARALGGDFPEAHQAETVRHAPAHE
jgi:hypothetical protein